MKIAVLSFCCWYTAASLQAQSVSTAQISGAVQDQQGAAIAGADVRVLQTETSFSRSVTTNSEGYYTLPNLPVGPYRLTVRKDGFTAYVQQGIVLQVNTNPTLNATLQVGSVSEQIVVEASAAMVETQSSGIGQVIDQQRVVDLPLNGRQATDLIFLSGGATTAPAGDLNSNKNYPTQTIAVGGGLPNAVSYLMDGASNNDPFNNLNLPFPFPDALQEFKVETSAIPARYGQHAAAAVNVVTKSGTNSLHGDLFEFLRNSVFNARDFFAPARDSLKRNQFGGTVGSAIMKDKVFFFAGYQGTIVRSDPPGTVNTVASQAMLNGDFSAFASAQCQGSNKTLAAPFTGNQIPVSLLNPQALNLLKHMPVSTNACGTVQYGIINDNKENQVLGRVDATLSEKHSLFGRYFLAQYQNPVAPSPNNVLALNKTGVDDRSQSFVLGDNYTLTPSEISSLRLTVNRTHGFRVMAPYFSPADLGVNVYSQLAGFMGISVGSGTAGFALGTGGTNPGYFNSLDYQVAEDFDLIKGNHQLAFGVNYIRAIMHSLNNRPTNGQFTFNGSATGLALADLLTGQVSGGFVQGNKVLDNDASNSIGIYAQDNWKATRHMNVSLGVRWEPYLPETNTNAFASHFDPALFSQGVVSKIYTSAPAGLMFPGDTGFPNSSNTSRRWNQFEPRIGVVYDPKGDGKMTVRASYGIFYDTPQLFFYTRFANNPPWGAQISLPTANFTNPWSAYPGGNPFPAINVLSKTSIFPQAGVYVNMPLDARPPYVQQWNLSLQKQIGANLLLSASYFGNATTHFWAAKELNPGVAVPGATLSTINQHRALYLQNSAQGQYYSTIGQLDDGGKAHYNALLLTAQRRLANNFSVLGNWTWSHCISDPETTELTGATYTNQNNRAADHANCSSDRRYLVNVSLVANTPKFNGRATNMLAGGWQLSAIFRYQSGNFTTVTTGADNALLGLSGGSQRPNQVLSGVGATGANQCAISTFDVCYLNKLAFTTVGLGPGILGNLAPLNIRNPGMVQVDMGVSRTFHIREKDSVQFKWEVFNVPNRLNPAAPNTTLSSGSFGQITSDINGSGSQAGDPRIMQFALKYVF